MKKTICGIAFLLILSYVLPAQTPGHTDYLENDYSHVVVEEWDIPFLNVLSGPIASIGGYLQWGAERAVREINDAGGIAGKPVKLTTIDTGLSPERGRMAMSRLLSWALCVMGPVPEPVIMEAVPVAAKEGIYSFTSSIVHYHKPIFRKIKEDVPAS